MTVIPVVVERKRGTRCCEEDLPSRLTPDEARTLSDDLAVLANPIRLQILGMLAAHDGQVCVCDLEAALPVKQPTVSHHLKLLRDAGLVEAERKGLWAFYSVQRDVLAALRERIAGGLTVLG